LHEYVYADRILRFSGRLPARRHDHTIDPAFACLQCGSSLKVVEGLDVKIMGIE
jgi:hypothetical protein